MRSKPKSPIWPYLGILACLFVLSVTAPRAWDRMARQASAPASPEERAARPPQALTQWVPPAEKVEVAHEATETVSPERGRFEETQSTGENDVSVSPVGPPLPPGGIVVPPVPEYAQQFLPHSIDGAVIADIGDPSRDAQEAPPADVEPAPTNEAAESPVNEPAQDSAPEQPAATHGWPEPQALLEQLAQAQTAAPTAAWVARAIELIRQLTKESAADNHAAQQAILVELRVLTNDGSTAPEVKDRVVRAKLARARYSLTRWLDAWEPAVVWDRVPPLSVRREVSPDRWMMCLNNVDALLHKNSAGATWRKYLELDALRALAKGEPGTAVDERRALARTLLDRMESVELTTSQRKFAAAGPLGELQDLLRSWAAEAVSSKQLLEHLARFEATGLPSDAESVANDLRGLTFSSTAASTGVSRAVGAHYRNANLRIAMAAPLINRMLPQPERTSSQVHETILEHPVHGCNSVVTKLSATLLPDAEMIRVLLEADGLISSQTVTDGGPVLFHNQGQSAFRARKQVAVTPHGISDWPAEAQAETKSNQLTGIETNVPLARGLVTRIARSQYDDSQGEAQAEAGQKLAMRAREQFDAEMRPQIVKAVQQVRDRRTDTARRLGLELEPVGMSSTPERAVARLRLAAPDQLGAFTPRPQAPADSWLSMQVNESLLNNILEQLDLNGRTFTLPELFDWVGKKLDRKDLSNQEDLPENVRMKFAERDAVHVQAEDGRLKVTLAFAELTQDRSRWRNFSVHTYYKPEAQGLDPVFARDGTIFLRGKTVRGIEGKLRAIFSKVLSRNRDIHLLEKRFIEDPRVQDLEITQFLVEDGWIGLSYSPKPAKGSIARKPK